jgi:uncharacterized membrane protein HdeD (DUF308 family)
MEFLNDKTVELVLLILVVFNVIATAIVQVLEAVKRPISEGHWLFKGITAIQKGIDLLSANRKHK